MLDFLNQTNKKKTKDDIREEKKVIERENEETTIGNNINKYEYKEYFDEFPQQKENYLL